MKQISKQLFFLTFLSMFFTNFVTAKDPVDSKELLNLKTKLDETVLKVFINRPIENWGKDIIQKGQETKQAKYSEWMKVIEEVGKFIKDSKSKELPPIYEKYFKPRYVGNKDPFTIDSSTKMPKNDIVTDIISQLGVVYSRSEKERFEKLKFISEQAKKRISILKDEINNVGKSYFAATAEARDVLRYLTDNILSKIIDAILPILDLPTPENLNIFIKALEQDSKKMEIFRLTLKQQLGESSQFVKKISELMAGYEGFGYQKIGVLADVKSDKIRWSEDSNSIYTFDRTIQKWDLKDKSQESYNPVVSESSNYALHYDPKKNYYLKAVNNIFEGAHLEIVDVKTNKSISKFENFVSDFVPFYHYNWSPSGNYVVVAADDKISIWDVSDRSKPKLSGWALTISMSFVSVYWGPSDDFAIVLLHRKKEIYILDFKDKHNVKSSKLYFEKEKYNEIGEAGISGNGKRVMGISKDNVLNIFDTSQEKNYKLVKEITLSPGADNSEFKYIAINMTGQYIATIVKKGEAQLWKAATPDWLLKLTDETKFVGDKTERVGVKKYLLLKAIMDNKEKQEKQNSKNIRPFEIFSGGKTELLNLTDIFTSLPEVVQQKLLKDNYVNLKQKT